MQMMPLPAFLFVIVITSDFISETVSLHRKKKGGKNTSDSATFYNHIYFIFLRWIHLPTNTPG